MKEDLPRFFVLSTQFVDPLYNSFYYMQYVFPLHIIDATNLLPIRLNIFYMLMEKINTFAEGKYDIQIPIAQITDDYENKRTDAWQRIEDMNITKRIVSTSKMIQNHRQNSGMSGGSSLARSNTGMSASTTSSYNNSLGVGAGVGARNMPPAMGRSPSASSFGKKAPPPPPSSFAAAPPPYSPSNNGVTAAAAAAAKRAPPPPPPLKPKPRVEPPVQYVVALYDFAPQVRNHMIRS